jgi:excisionase family DNA binding protein
MSATEYLRQQGYCSVEEFAEMVGKSRTTIRRLLRDGVIPSYTSDVDKRRKYIRFNEATVLIEPQLISGPTAS